MNLWRKLEKILDIYGVRFTTVPNKIYLITLRQEEKFGTKSIIELLEAKQNLYISQIEVISLYYDKIYSGFELDALLGKLTQK